jgi:hypothetical protein
MNDESKAFGIEVSKDCLKGLIYWLYAPFGVKYRYS